MLSFNAVGLCERIAILTRDARKKSDTPTELPMNAPTRLTHDTVVLYGKASGSDYARTRGDDLLKIVEAYASTGRDTCKVTIPQGGDAAQASIHRVFSALLPDFDLSLDTDQIDIYWGAHYELA
jgi:hypothetical protein